MWENGPGGVRYPGYPGPGREREGCMSAGKRWRERGERMQPYFRFILAQVSRRVTIRLKTGLPGLLSRLSGQK